MPCPYCVILTAVQSSDLRLRISPVITEVLPMFRVCPPITTAFIGPPLPNSVLFSVAPLYERRKTPVADRRYSFEYRSRTRGESTSAEPNRTVAYSRLVN